MITGIFHAGSGLGNQLHRYIATRCLAIDKGYDFGMENPDLFKGKGIFNIDTGMPFESLELKFVEERINLSNGTDIRPYDSKLHEINDNTTIDGEFQDEKYWEHHTEEVREWLKCESKPFNIPFIKPEEICVLNLRGGEYVSVADLFLSKEYWYTAMEHMKQINPNMRFGIVTDDVLKAREWFPNFPIRHDEGDWSAINQAHYLILSNSSFAILPAYLNQNVKQIIAPKYWARHNISNGYWALAQNMYKGWTYQDRNGELFDYDTCKKELEDYENKNRTNI